MTSYAEELQLVEELKGLTGFSNLFKAEDKAKRLLELLREKGSQGDDRAVRAYGFATNVVTSVGSDTMLLEKLKLVEDELKS